MDNETANKAANFAKTLATEFTHSFVASAGVWGGIAVVGLTYAKAKQLTESRRAKKNPKNES